MSTYGSERKSAVGNAFGQRFLHSRNGALLTHGSLLLLVAAEFTLVLRTPLWVALIPCVLIQHRVGILLHDYVHGIPFRRYKHSLAVLAALDGLLLHFGAVEIFRGTHLAHHRWMNTERDPGFWVGPNIPPWALIPRPLWRLLFTLRGDVSLYFRFLIERQHLHYIYVKPFRVVGGVVLSAVWILACCLAGLSRIPVALVAIQLALIVPLSLRAAIEHSSYRGDTNFANEYKVWLPLFNRNRHMHHHLQPTVPWYLLRFCTPSPLPPLSYWKHWYHVFVKGDYVLMRPLRGSDELREIEGVIGYSMPAESPRRGMRINIRA
jgi:fatty acid desaturase